MFIYKKNCALGRETTHGRRNDFMPRKYLWLPSFCQCFQAPRVNLISLCRVPPARKNTQSVHIIWSTSTFEAAKKKAFVFWCCCLRAKDLCISARRAFKRACCAALITTKGVLSLGAAGPAAWKKRTGRRLLFYFLGRPIYVATAAAFRNFWYCAPAHK